ncbi:efflux transporter outer membrane subunit [Burkholderia seminalis]|uniref:Efflux transporter outer membrane subunit n=3 Tax=Burkholderia TaxID=32008 RepID=A0A8A8DHK9_9BURK|nr:efflux transporter outer membrane subunit [Burkholderia sp. Tr-20355]QTO23881.1 efflux transporter outer membrane subunit [Burkholderia seminalis]RQS81793.1 RND transporter [Burkholderia seminalis]RQS96882.1 RND transporter [Burkholderia seminalis]
MRAVALPPLFQPAFARRMRLVALAAGAALLSGCLSFAPPDERPAAPIPAAFPDPSARGPAIAQAPPAWQDYFVDARLRALIEQALANNRDLRAAVARVEQARAVYGIRGADQWPTIGAGAAYARFRTPGGFLTPAPIVGQVYEVQLAETQWEIDFWGRVRNLKASALQRYLASDAARQAMALSVITGVANAYLTLCEIDERIALTRATIDTRRESLRIFRLRHAAGAISRLDLTQSEILLQQAESLGTQLAQARASAADALALLVGATPERADTPLTLDDGAVMPSLAPGLPASLLTRRPDVMAAEHELQATRANIGAARAAFFPRIALTSAIGSGSSALHDLLSSGAGVWSVIPNVTLPLVDGGRNRSNLALARAQRDEALAQYEQTVQRAFRDVSDALAARYWLADQVAIEHATLVSQMERARLAKLRYDSGATRFLEVLDAQRDLMNAEQQWVMTRRALLSSRVALYGALGGGTTDTGKTAAAPDHLSTDSGSRQ